MRQCVVVQREEENARRSTPSLAIIWKRRVGRRGATNRRNVLVDMRAEQGRRGGGRRAGGEAGRVGEGEHGTRKRAPLGGRIWGRSASGVCGGKVDEWLLERTEDGVEREGGG
jgi:hypothetical protein